ncbi:MAG: DUF4296 domain-containing protein [Bacteroidales bacterium]|nr:DUF4296 domain-containing protein [Bacteroidales bacterium]
MKLKVGHIALAALVLLLLLPGCGRRGRVIPAGKLAEIYVDMFLADQWVSDNYSSRRMADTSDFYGPIFKAHGYTFKDYDRSVNHYLHNPEGYSHLLDKSVEILEKRIKALKNEQERREKVEELERYLRDNLLPRVDFEKDDTLLWRPDSLMVDSLVVDSLALDSLAVADSLAAAMDSLAVSADTLAAAAHKPAPKAEAPVAPKSNISIKDSLLNAKGRDRIRAHSFKEARELARD